MSMFKKFMSRFHDWEYHEPGNRKCRCCGLEQTQLQIGFSPVGNWWEDLNIGFHAPCNKKVPVRKIVGVACWYQNKLYSLPPPNRHHDLKELFDGRMPGGASQGFIDEGGYFLSRHDAMLVAKNNGQLNRQPGGYDGDLLFSEDL